MCFTNAQPELAITVYISPLLLMSIVLSCVYPLSYCDTGTQEWSEAENSGVATKSLVKSSSEKLSGCKAHILRPPSEAASVPKASL